MPSADLIKLAHPHCPRCGDQLRYDAAKNRWWCPCSAAVGNYATGVNASTYMISGDQLANGYH